MGVCGCGKSSIGQAFARAVEARFFDGDELHPAENIEKMSRGDPLTDADREPWLDKVGDQLGAGDGPMVIACSALKRVYRERIVRRAKRPVAFLFLEGSRDLLTERMKHRDGHFMPTSLLDSQLETLERPGPDELSIRVSIDQTPDEIVADLLAQLKETSG